MLQAARRSAALLPEPDRVARFLLDRANSDGGFNSRSGRSDLYYTVFALEGLLALASSRSTGKMPVLREATPSPYPSFAKATEGGPLPSRERGEEEAQQAGKPVPRAEQYLRTFAGGAGLDFVHLSCLARCWAALSARPAEEDRRQMLELAESHRTSDGGYNQIAGAKTGSAYGCFLAVGTYEDLGATLPDPDGIVACLESLRTPHGGYSNDRQIAFPLAPATAAAIMIQHALARPIDPSAAAWLAGCQAPEGGFLAMPGAPVSDLLSTATSLHALAAAGAPAGEADLNRRFVMGLFQGDAFAGSFFDPTPDSEYTYYGLLALGHLV
jgi:hypothetical protein